MKNLFISDLHEKDVEHCTTNLGLNIRRKTDKPFKKLCNIFTNAHIIKEQDGNGLKDDECFEILKSVGIYEGKNPFILKQERKFKNSSESCLNCISVCDENEKTIDKWCSKYEPYKVLIKEL